ncbi:conjugative transfer relaxase/helicase TraI [Francisellaceae bacterium]|nr:conjugative transfer relaxase/helicase TraI [Francisellaceae bacterium]
MLSISPIKQSASDASKYYTSEEKNYYLSEKGIGNSTSWTGKLAEHYGLAGKEIDPAILERVLSGIAPDESQTVSTGKDEKTHRTGWDFTLSAPKSASIMALVYGDKRFIDAHDKAVELTARELEKNSAQVRVSTEEGQTFQNTGKMCLAKIRHCTSRANDPQVHTHLLAPNMSLDDDGKLRAMASTMIQKNGVINGMAERVYHDQKYYSAHYQSAYAHLLQEKGIEVESVGNGQWELKGFDQALKKGFSKRRTKITDLAKELGIHSQAGMDAITESSRKAKDVKSMDELSSKWQAEAKAYAPDFKGELSKTELKPETISSSATFALRQAMSHMGTVQTSFRFEKLMETALADFGVGKGVTVPNLKVALEDMIKKGEAVPLHNGEIASRKSLHMEKNLVESVSQKSKYMSVKVNPLALDRLNLKTSNKAVVADTLASGHQTNVINLKGDRIPLLESLIVAAEGSGKDIQVIAPNRSYLADLTGLKKQFGQSTSAFQWFNQSGKQNKFHTVHYAHKEQVDFKNKLVVIDQAQRLGFKDMQALIDKAHAQHAKVVLINQTNTGKQHLNGHVMDAIKKGNVNQSDFQYQKMTRTHVKLHEQKDTDTKHKDIAALYAGLSQSEKANTAVLAATHKDMKNLTQHIRHELKNTGELSRVETEIKQLTPVFLTDAQKQVSQSFKKGMELHISEKGGKGIYKVMDVYQKGNTLQVASLVGEHKVQKHTFNPSKIAKDIKAFNVESVKVGEGDKLNIFGILGATNNITVTKANDKGIEFVNDQGQSRRLSHEALAQSTLNYNYVQTISGHSAQKAEALVSIPSYMASKELLGELTQKIGATLQLFTDNEDKLAKGFAQSKMRASSINTVLKSGDESLTRTVNNQTVSSLKSDVQKSVTGLMSSYQDGKHLNQLQIVDKAVSFAMADLSEKEAAFRHQDVVKTAIVQSLEEYKVAITADEVALKLNELKEKGDVLSSHYADGSRWVTKEAYACEKNIVSQVNAGRNTVEPLMNLKEVSKTLASSNLSKGQKEAVTLIATTKDRFVGIQGLAGTGKSTMLDQAQQMVNIQAALNESGNNKVQFIGLAPTHQAVHELKEKGIHSQTSQSLLQDVLHASSKDLAKYKDAVFLLDESSMVTNQDMLKFTRFVNENNLRAVPLGDIKQIKGIGQGKPFEVLQQVKALEVAHMGEIIRQSVLKDEQGNIIKGDVNLLKAVHHAVAGNVKNSLTSLNQQQSMGRIHYREDRSVYQKVVNHSDLEGYIKQNVVSTFKEKTGDKGLDKAIAHQNMIKGAAFDYLSRTDDTRDNTLLIAYSHDTRDQVTDYIRKGLTTDGTLKNESEVTRLRAINHSDTRKANMASYEGSPIISIAGKDYYEVAHIDKAHKLVELRDINTHKSKIIYPEKVNASQVAFYQKESVKLADNDKVMMRGTDPKGDYKTNDEFKVSKIEQGVLTLTNNEKEITLNTNKINQTHWDHGYAKTANSVQGATAKYAIGIDNPDSPLANLTRLYVGQSRASDHYRMYTTSDKALMLKMTNHDGDKYSALETIREYISDKNNPAKTKDNILFTANSFKQRQAFRAQDKSASNNYKNSTEELQKEPTNNEKAAINSKTQYKNIQKTYQSLDKKDVSRALSANTENVLYSILGEPNKSQSDNNTWAYGQNKGSLKVTMTGEFRGHWRDWSGGQEAHGDLVSLIMQEKGLTLPEALEYGATLASVEPTERTIDKVVEVKPRQSAPSKTFKYATQIQEKSVPIQGTIAEKYLQETRGIRDTSSLNNIAFNPKVYSRETGQNHPALIASIKDANGDLKGVEAIYLKPENNQKADLDIAKRSYGSKAGSAITVQGEPSTEGISYLAEGVETTLSIQQSVPEDSHVLAVSGKQNFSNIDPDLLSDKVVLCLDNDGVDVNQDKVIQASIERLEEMGKEVFTTMPNDIKTDFNDMLKESGSTSIKQQIITDIAGQMRIDDVDVLDKLADKFINEKHTGNQDNYIDEIRKVAADYLSDAQEYGKDSSLENAVNGYKNSKEEAKNETTNNEKQTPDNRLFEYELTL